MSITKSTVQSRLAVLRDLTEYINLFYYERLMLLLIDINHPTLQMRASDKQRDKWKYDEIYLNFTVNISYIEKVVLSKYSFQRKNNINNNMY